MHSLDCGLILGRFCSLQTPKQNTQVLKNINDVISNVVVKLEKHSIKDYSCILQTFI